jgi:hypothetical protein
MATLMGGFSLPFTAAKMTRQKGYGASVGPKQQQQDFQIS